MDLPEIIRQTRYKGSRYLRRIAARISPAGAESTITFPNLGSEKLPSSSPRALIIYSSTGIDRYVRGNDMNDPIFNKHTIYWESVEMVKILNKAGYIVDYCDVWKQFRVDWNKYTLIIDNLNNLKDAGSITGQKKIYWATNNHWLPWNRGELERTQWFKDRTGIILPTTRQMPCILSDEYADYLTYFGTDLQIQSFSSKPKKELIKISSCHIPDYKKKDMSRARNKFLWIASGGAMHKGTNLVIEAFSKMPEAELFIIANLKDEPRFYEWAKKIISQNTNIHEMGWYDLTSKEFDELADGCIGTLYLSSSCGGPGSTARVLHNGLIPIVTPTGFVRAEHLGYTVNGETADEIINSTIEKVREVMSLPEKELHQKSDAVREFARKNHTREAFSESFSEFIDKLQ